MDTETIAPEKLLAGVLDTAHLKKLITGASPLITTGYPKGIDEKQIQPSSLDLTLSGNFFGMQHMALPMPGQPIADLTKEAEYSFIARQMDEALLHSGYTYIAPLRESVKLPKGFSAKFSPKSSIGRVDVFVRVLANGVPFYDYLPDGYEGQLYLEITPLSFRIKLGPGESLTQMRIKIGNPAVPGWEVPIMQAQHGMFSTADGPIPGNQLDVSDRGVYMHVDLNRDIVGFASRSSAPPISFEGVGRHDWRRYWEPIYRPPGGKLLIEPGRFYLLATKERVKIPANVCGDILPYDTTIGEIRTHYAGFFDPLFGFLNDGTIGVLEVRGREAPYRLFDGQPICLMGFERLIPGGTGSYEGNYADPRPSLSKFFSNRYEAWELPA